MKCTEYIYDEHEVNDFVKELMFKGIKNIDVTKGVDEDADAECWEVTWDPEPLE